MIGSFFDLDSSCCSCVPCERLPNDCLGFLFDATQMVVAKEALGVNKTKDM
ncbi:MAG: hypothetical protein WCE61_21290 [Candidatus Acidiferrum sp.]